MGLGKKSCLNKYLKLVFFFFFYVAFAVCSNKAENMNFSHAVTWTEIVESHVFTHLLKEFLFKQYKNKV